MSGELGFEDRVKIFGPVDPSQTVAVSEGSEYSNFVGVFESYAGGHFDVGFVFFVSIFARYRRLFLRAYLERFSEPSARSINRTMSFWPTCKPLV